MFSMFQVPFLSTAAEFVRLLAPHTQGVRMWCVLPRAVFAGDALPVQTNPTPPRQGMDGPASVFPRNRTQLLGHARSGDPRPNATGPARSRCSGGGFGPIVRPSGRDSAQGGKPPGSCLLQPRRPRYFVTPSVIVPVGLLPPHSNLGHPPPVLPACPRPFHIPHSVSPRRLNHRKDGAGDTQRRGDGVACSSAGGGVATGREIRRIQRPHLGRTSGLGVLPTGRGSRHGRRQIGWGKGGSDGEATDNRQSSNKLYIQNNIVAEAVSPLLLFQSGRNCQKIMVKTPGAASLHTSIL